MRSWARVSSREAEGIYYIARRRRWRIVTRCRMGSVGSAGAGVGVLLPFDENDPEAKHRLKQFRLGMRDLDWIEGRNILIEFQTPLLGVRTR